ncbi:hypothetical protein DLD82_02425 [Methanospirillum stamsii]|uniref:Uncharacterized protein n=2 Tax=Methanospirillum stamsii TaxID=1277351 RepID=A0A2V2N7A5_9EURY|nr:hypothetical protein DLD82_02425 [Methanospirillum stamsii]
MVSTIFIKKNVKLTFSKIAIKKGNFSQIHMVGLNEFFQKEILKKYFQEYRPYIIPFVMFLFLTIIPIEGYIMGSGFGYGVRGICYRFQITGLGESFIPISYEFQYVLSGLISGKNMYALFIWAGGSVLFGLATMLQFLNCIEFRQIQKRLSLLFFTISIFLFIVSEMVYYSPFFYGPSGVCVLFGIPVVIALCWMMWQEKKDNA